MRYFYISYAICLQGSFQQHFGGTAVKRPNYINQLDFKEKVAYNHDCDVSDIVIISIAEITEVDFNTFIDT